jgi:hypothetical protein
VIEPGNGYLAGCGFLGELACDGSRDVGLFWREALGWPLVWDQDQETAIQSPLGGTKVAWGGPPTVPKEAPNGERLEVAVARTDFEAEVHRHQAFQASQPSGRCLLGSRDTTSW